MTTQQDFDGHGGQPEDSGEGFYPDGGVVKQFLEAPTDLEAVLVNGRMTESEYRANINQYLKALMYRSPQALEEVRLNMIATIGRNGEARAEGVFVTARSATPELIRRIPQTGGWRKVFNKKKDPAQQQQEQM